MLSSGLVLAAGAAALVAIAWAWRRRSPRRGSHRGGGEAPAGYLHFRDQPERDGFPVAGPTVRIGRQRDNDLVLEDTSVSRHHAEIHRGGDGAMTLVDLDSLNGVFVNERQIKSAALSDGDSVEIGDVRLSFSRHASAPREPRRVSGAGLEKTVIARPDDLLTGQGSG
jgi:pSer/pThr/pTyr-binding forkhead associated (FHA) protein